MSKTLKVFLLTLSALLLIYMLMPGPKSISDFPSLPNSTKSTLEGDTIQVPNVAAYFSANFRDVAVPFYFDAYAAKTTLPFGPLRLNYPPEFAYTAIKDQTESTYLEEIVYPLRDSLFVNGMEPVNKDGSPRFLGAGEFEVDDSFFPTKVTLRYYPSNSLTRILVWMGINFSVLFLIYVSRKVLGRD